MSEIKLERRSKTKCVYFSRGYRETKSEVGYSYCNYNSPYSMTCYGVCSRYYSYKQEAEERDCEEISDNIW